MLSVTIEPNYASWRDAARVLIAEKVEPHDVVWIDTAGADDELGMFQTLAEPSDNTPPLRVSRQFVAIAQTLSCHRSGKQWSLLYEILWKLTLGNEKDVLQHVTHPTVRTLEQMRKTISRDIHKMRAFVRFRRVEDGANGLESYVAWFEPEHRIVRLNAPFFSKRFGGMNWSILTPDECAHWDGRAIQFTAGVEKSAAPDADALEDMWRAYYRSIFNPARVKIKMMQTEMPKKYWKNLPEAEIIEDLIAQSADRVHAMMQEENRPLKVEPKNSYLEYLRRLNDADS